jgi:small subunit ribosomal protein S6
LNRPALAPGSFAQNLWGQTTTMAVNTYECMFLLDPNRVSGDVHAAAQQLHSIFERHQAEVLASRQWDERRLAYPIKGHKKGLYYLTYIKSEGKNLANMERDFALNEMVLRSLVLRIAPQLVDTMLALARDEHALALQAVPDDGTGDGSSYDGGRGPRRGRHED